MGRPRIYPDAPRKVVRDRDIKELTPAHKRVLDLLLFMPSRDGRGSNRSIINMAFICEKTSWSESTIWRMLQEAERFLGVHGIGELISLWRARRTK